MEAPCNVFVTVDVETWPPGWEADDQAMTDAFKRYIHGVGNPRDHGLPYQLKVFAEHGLKAVFFVEPLFASVIGRAALEDVVGLIREAGQDVQLHLHPEWLGRAGDPELPGPRRLAMSELTLDEQTRLMVLGQRWLTEAGAEGVTAFRAGSFGANRDTLGAVAGAGMQVDSSQSRAGPYVPLDASLPDDLSTTCEGVFELPLTSFRDAFGRTRPFQIGSSSTQEMKAVLRGCLAGGRTTAVILSHSAELLDGGRQRADRLVVRRFRALCRFLERNAGTLPTCHMGDVPRLGDGNATAAPASELSAPVAASAWRMAEQALRRW